jgi:hypothetical protein
MQRPFLLSLSCLSWGLVRALATDPTPTATPPTDWIDPDTRHRIVRLSAEPGTASLSFNPNTYTPDGKKLLVTSPSRISTIDLTTRKIDLTALAAKIKDLKAVDGALVATASGDDAAALLAPAGGRGGPAPAGPRQSSVTLKFWLKDGALAKYSTHSVGTFTMPNGDERELDSTTTVEVKNVGTAQVEVPAAAKKKFPH